MVHIYFFETYEQAVDVFETTNHLFHSSAAPTDPKMVKELTSYLLGTLMGHDSREVCNWKTHSRYAFYIGYYIFNFVFDYICIKTYTEFNIS